MGFWVPIISFLTPEKKGVREKERERERERVGENDCMKMIDSVSNESEQKKRKKK